MAANGGEFSSTDKVFFQSAFSSCPTGARKPNRDFESETKKLIAAEITEHFMQTLGTLAKWAIPAIILAAIVLRQGIRILPE